MYMTISFGKIVISSIHYNAKHNKLKAAISVLHKCQNSLYSAKSISAQNRTFFALVKIHVWICDKEITIFK